MLKDKMQRDNKWSWISEMISLVPYCSCSPCCFKTIIFTVIFTHYKAIVFPLLLWWLRSILYPKAYLASDSFGLVPCHCPLGSTYFSQDLDPPSSPSECLAYLSPFCLTLASRETRCPPPFSSIGRQSSVSRFLMLSVFILCRQLNSGCPKPISLPPFFLSSRNKQYGFALCNFWVWVPPSTRVPDIKHKMPVVSPSAGIQRLPGNVQGPGSLFSSPRLCPRSGSVTSAL